MDLTNYSEITALLRRHGFHFSHSLGQNFLTAAWVPERIAESAELSPADGVLEIGPGVGCLTEQLSRRAGKVLALELDQRLEGVLSETLAGRDNVEMLFTDAMKADLPALCKEHLGEGPWKVCANLPYNVTSPLITALLRAGCFESLTLMVQKEVAERICAGPGRGDYGAFSVLVQWYTRPQLLFTVPPDCFVPRPKVTSAVLRLVRRSAPPAAVEDEALFFQTVRAAFGQRRKTLPNALAAGFPGLERGAILSAMERSGLAPTARGETLDIPAFAALSKALGEQKDAT